MIILSHNANKIKIPKYNAGSGDNILLQIRNILTNGYVEIPVTDVGNQYYYEFQLTNEQLATIQYGENICWLNYDGTLLCSVLMRKIKEFEADNVYNQEVDDTPRYTVRIVAGDNGYIIVNGSDYEEFSGMVREGTELEVEARGDDHYTFVAWNDGSTDNPRSITVNEDIQLQSSYAYSDLLNVSIATNDTDFGYVTVDGVQGDYSEQVAYGTELTITATNSVGHHFVSWSDGNSNTTRTITVTSNVNITANFAVDMVSVNITAGSNGSVSINGVQGDFTGQVAYGTALVVEAVPDAHYAFVAWSDGDDTNPRTITVTSSVTLSSSYEIADYFNVSISAGSNGYVSVNGVQGDYSEQVAYGTELTITATNATGYHFTEWSDGNTTSPRTITVTSSLTLTASFAINMYQVLITSGANGHIVVDNVSGNYSEQVPYGTVLSLEAVPDIGYNFQSWSDGNTNASRTVTVTAPLSLGCGFEIKQFTLRVNSGSNGAITINGGGLTHGYYEGTFNYGTQVVVGAVADTGYHFTEWSDGNTDNPRTVTMTENTTITGVYEADVVMCHLVVTAGANGSVSVEGVSGDYDDYVVQGTVVHITATSNTGYHFTNWSDGYTLRIRTLTVNSDTTLSSAFAINTYNVVISAGNNGSVTVNNVQGDYSDTVNYGTVLTVEATPDSHFDFNGWSDSDNTNPRHLTITSNLTLSASFASQQLNTQIYYTTSSGDPAYPYGPAYDSNQNELQVIDNTYNDGLGIMTFDGDLYMLGSDFMAYNDDLTSVIIPASVYDVSWGAFYGCHNLSDVEFEAGSVCHLIATYAFAETAISSIVLPDTIDTIENDAFAGCDNLGYIECMGDWSGEYPFVDIASNVQGTKTYRGSFHCIDAAKQFLLSSGGQDWLLGEKGFVYDAVGEGIVGNFTDGNLYYTATDANGNSVTNNYYNESNGWCAVGFPSDTVTYYSRILDGQSGEERMAVMNFPSLQSIGQLCGGGGTLYKLVVLNTTTAPAITANTFNGPKLFGTLVYPSGSDYSSWLSTSPGYLGWYGWNGIDINANIVLSDNNNTVDGQYFRDANGNAVTTTTQSGGGLIKVRTSADIVTIADGTSGSTWLSGNNKYLVYVKSTITSVGDYQMAGFQVFYDTSELTRNIQVAGKNSFQNSHFNSARFESLASVGEFAFDGFNNNLGECYFGGTFTDIPRYAFRVNVSKVTVASRYVQSISYRAFRNNLDELSFNHVQLSNSLTVHSDFVESLSNYSVLSIPYGYWSDLETAWRNKNANSQVYYFNVVKYHTSDGNTLYTESENVQDNIYHNGLGIAVYGNGGYFGDNSNLTDISYIYGELYNNIFANCHNLTSVNFSDCTKVYSEALDGTSIVSISIPATLLEIELRPWRIDTIQSITVDANNPNYTDGNGTGLYDSNGVCIYLMPTAQPYSGCTGFAGWMMSNTHRTMDLVVPASVDGMYDCCVYEETNVQNTFFDGDPSQWQGEIDNNYNLYWVDAAYLSDCQNRWPDIRWMIKPTANVLQYRSSNGYPVTPTTTSGFGGNYVDNIMTEGLGTLIFDAPITAIPNDAFKNDTNITYIRIPEDCASIGDSAFEGCTRLEEILSAANAIPTRGTDCFKNVKSGGVFRSEKALDFKGWFERQNDGKSLGWRGWNEVDDGIICNNYYSVLYDTTNHNPDLTIDTSCFYKRYNISATLYQNSGYSGDYTGDAILMFYDYPVNYIDGNAMGGSGNTSTVKRVRFENNNNIVSLRGGIFEYNTSLTYLSLPESCQYFDLNAIRYCTNLTTLVFGKYTNVVNMPYANLHCGSLNNITFRHTKPPVGMQMPTGVAATGTMHIPSGSDINSYQLICPSGWTIRYYNM